MLYLFSAKPALAEIAIPPGLSALDPSEIRQGFIAFVNMTTIPGVEGSSLQVDLPERQTDLWRSSLGFSAEFTLRNPIYNGYWGLALVGGGLDDVIEVEDDFGETVTLDVDRDIVALRGAFGLSFPVDQHLKIRPFASLILSRSKTKTEAYGGIVETLIPEDEGFFVQSSAEAVSGVASLDVLYNRWYGKSSLNLQSRYNIIYTDTISIDNPVLDTWAWNQSLLLKAELTGATNWYYLHRNWRWSTYISHNNYLDQDKTALGFRYLNEVGVGLDWDMHIKPFDWFGWRFIGIRAGYSFGDDVTGFNVGITAK